MMMLAYSAKNMVNDRAMYSTLKPDMSSDSPSVKANGAWLVSVRLEITHIMARGQDGKISLRCTCVIINIENVNGPFICRTDKRIIANITSYEIVWATAHRALISVYFEFEAYPDQMME